jgi:hypothetical protein
MIEAQFATDHLDNYCLQIKAHTNWAYAEHSRERLSSILDNPNIHEVILIYENKEEDGCCL